GLNLAVNPVKQKFVAEADLTGEHVDIVRLHAPALSQQYLALKAKDKTPADAKLYASGKPIPAALAQHQASLLQQQQRVLQQVEQLTGAKQVRRQFTATLNGFSLSLTQDEAQQIASLSSVASVQRSTLYQLHTDA